MQSHLRHLLVISVLFFLFGFITNLNDILIPHLKTACQLNDFQSAFVQFAFFGAYFLMSIPASAIIRRLGYKRGIIIGLLLAAAGALLFQPAAASRSYLMFLGGLAVLASGITLLQVSANPYVSLLGAPEKAASRLSLMGGLNSLGATLGPLLGGIFILGAAAKTADQIAALTETDLIIYLTEQAGMVRIPYLALAIGLILLAFLMSFARLPEVQAEQPENTFRTLRIREYPNLLLGIPAIFLYVGAEVGVAAFIIRYGESLNIEGYTQEYGSRFTSAYWMGAMIFRFIGIFLLQKLRPLHVLGWNSILAMILLAISILSGGYVALISAVLVGCCNAMMWPIIFPKAIEGLGIHTAKGSSYLIMAVVGGAFVPLLMGYLSDIIGIQQAYWVPLACYIFLAYYGWRFRDKGVRRNRAESE